MKRFLGLVLLLTCLFCSCHTTPPDPPAAPDSTAAMESVELSSGEQTSTEEETSSVRYIRSYEISELTTIPNNTDIIIHDGKIYYYKSPNKTVWSRTILDFDGNTEVTELTKPAEFSGETWSAAYPLSDDRHLILYHADILIIDSVGNIIQSQQLPDDLANDIFWDWVVNEKEDGSLHILLYYGKGLYYFDESLTLQTTIDVTDNFLMSLSFPYKPFAHYIGNDCFCLGTTVSNSSICNTADGTHMWNRLHVPSELTAENLVHGTTENIIWQAIPESDVTTKTVSRR